MNEVLQKGHSKGQLTKQTPLLAIQQSECCEKDIEKSWVFRGGTPCLELRMAEEWLNEVGGI